MSEHVRFLDRSGWEPGPWDTEPDLIHRPPTLLYRQNSGGWGAMVAIPKERRDDAAQFIAKQGKVKLDNRTHNLAIMSFDSSSRGHQHIDCSKLYVGFFYNHPGDMRPAGTKYVKDLPEEMRQPFMQDACQAYVTAERAQIYAGLLASVLNNLKIPVKDSGAKAG